MGQSRPRSPYLSFVVYPYTGWSEDESCENHDNDEKYPRKSAGEAHSELREREVVQIDDIHEGGIDGPTAGHHVDISEDLEGVDDVRH